MSEADYQRGLRGGDCPVSIREFARWQDWKAGRDAYESAQAAEADARMAEFLTPAELQAEMAARMRELDAKMASLERQERQNRKYSQERKRSEDRTVTIAVPAACLSIGFVAGIIGGYILKWIFGIPVVVTVVGSLIVAGLWAWGAVNAILQD
jgi:F0F1-type ATP synthase assembly protein I